MKHSRTSAKMEAQVDALCLLPQPKEGQQQFKNKKQPELTENQIVWKFDKQGVKEDTFIQNSRRTETRSQAEKDSRQGSGWRTQQGSGLWRGAARSSQRILRGNGLQTGRSHIPAQINQEEQRGSETDLETPMLQLREIKPQTSDWKHCGG